MLFWLNPECPILPELRALILKTVAASNYIRQFLSGLDGVQASFIFGSFAQDEPDAHSDLDLMIEVGVNSFFGKGWHTGYLTPTVRGSRSKRCARPQAALRGARSALSG
jgi:hypothetical protein